MQKVLRILLRVLISLLEFQAKILIKSLPTSRAVTSVKRLVEIPTGNFAVSLLSFNGERNQEKWWRET